MKKLVMMLLMFVVLAGFSIAALTVLSPSQYTTLTTTSVNTSIDFSQVVDGETVWNATIWNSSESNTPFSVLASALLFNGSQWSNITTLVDGKRHFLFVNISNVSNGAVVSSTRIVDVDTKFLIYQLGVFAEINFTLDEGNIKIGGDMNASGTVSSRRLRLQNNTQPSENCDASSSGEIMYNASGPVRSLIWCDGLAWAKI